MCGALALKIAISLKKWWAEELKNHQHSMLFTLLFMLLLQFNNSEQAAEAEGQKSVCGLRYHVWHAGTKNSNFIEKRWGEELKNNQHSLLSHHSFCVTAAFL
jgi:uncharacterized membrane protein